MIYLFTWNNPYLVKEKTFSWKKLFIEKHWDFNIVHFKNIIENDDNLILENILSEWFLSEKKLIIIDDIPLSSKQKNSKFKEKQLFIEWLLEKIPENNIVLFSSIWVDKRGTFYKKLKKIWAKIEEFNIDENNIFNIISKKYSWKIDSNWINLLIKYKSWNLDKIISEIEKLLILKEKISINDIEKNIIPELEESIFQLIDDLLNLNIIKSLEKLEIILSQTSVYAFYNNLLANIRVQVFIEKLKLNKKNNTEIKNLLDLWKRAFILNKNYKISYKNLNIFYENIVNLDKKMKSWWLIWSEENILKYELEKEILKLKI